MNLSVTEASPAPAPGPLKFLYPGGSRPLEGYTIKRGVGRGGFGEVYFATSDAGKEVALKLIRRNLDIELRGVTQCLNLKHPHLIGLYDIRQDEQDDYWVVMEYVSGESLEAIIARNGEGVAAGEALRFLRGIAAGVAYLHDRGIVHRDLKPGNIFLDEGLIKIGDYGLSKFISASRRSGQTESVGTVHYMAPEIVNGKYGKEIDIYALGIIFYEMLTGRVPYEGESVGEVLMKHLTAEPDLRDVPEPYRTVIGRLLCKDPEKRYSTVQAMLEDLDARLAGRAPVVLADAPAPENAPAKVVLAEIRPEPTSSAPRARTQPQGEPKPRRLTKSSSDQVVGGVCGGFASYFGIDPLWIRVPLAILVFVASGIPVLVYVLLLCLMPDDEEAEAEAETSGFSAAIDVAAIAAGLLRLLVALIFGVGAGLVTGGVAVALMGHTHAAYFVGPGAGLIIAGLAAFLLLRRIESTLPLVLVSLLLGGGIGLLTGACALGLTDRHEFAALVGVGVGFLTAGTMMTAMQLAFARSPWRILSPILSGVGVGSLTTGLAMSQWGDAAYVLGPGAGFLVCGVEAYLLLFSPWASQSLQRGALARMVERKAPWINGAVVGSVFLGGVGLALVTVTGTPRQVAFMGTGFSNPGASCYLGCGSRATVNVSINRRGLFEHRQLCEVHARQAAWEAEQNGYPYTIFDLATGQERTDLKRRATSAPRSVDGKH
jgi:phage shock protein PspC (stress-responsive transcriptional regulator)